MGKTSNYKYVRFVAKKHGKPFNKWEAQVYINQGNQSKSYHDEERDAALAVDKKLISLGRDPVNILKPKTNTNDAN